MKFGKLKILCKNLYTKSNLSGSATKLLILVHTPLNLSFLKTLLVNLPFSQQVLTSRKENELSFSVLNENLIFLCLLLMYPTNREICSGFSKNTEMS